ncbi:MAG: hypothetical protein M3498_01845 [Deinococcota bacterium]|jgi:hypothetical protein|nr:hypothetical protein [Deinococcota bacterium]
MNYAALLALLVLLSFSLPLLVRLAEAAGVPRGLGVVTTLVIACFFLGWVIIRWRVRKRLAVETRIAQVVKAKAERPDDLSAFYSGGEHVGDLLLALGREREALAEYEAHLLVAKRTQQDGGSIRRTVARLKGEQTD